MYRWGIVALAVFFLLIIYPTPFARPVYLAALWISLAVGKAESKSESAADVDWAMQPRKEPFVPSGFVPGNRSGNPVWSDPAETNPPQFKFPSDPASNRGTAGDLHWKEESGDSAANDRS